MLHDNLFLICFLIGIFIFGNMKPENQLKSMTFLYVILIVPVSRIVNYLSPGAELFWLVVSIFVVAMGLSVVRQKIESKLPVNVMFIAYDSNTTKDATFAKILGLDVSEVQKRNDAVENYVKEKDGVRYINTPAPDYSKLYETKYKSVDKLITDQEMEEFKIAFMRILQAWKIPGPKKFIYFAQQEAGRLRYNNLEQLKSLRDVLDFPTRIMNDYTYGLVLNVTENEMNTDLCKKPDNLKKLLENGGYPIFSEFICSRKDDIQSVKIKNMITRVKPI